jgi:hypothetical protein
MSAVTKIRVYHRGLTLDTFSAPAYRTVRPSIMYTVAAKKSGPMSNSVPWMMNGAQAVLSK